MNTTKILISACLLGQKVRYDGKHLLLDHPIIERWSKTGVLCPICPEVAGGLTIPRPAAEIQVTDSKIIVVKTIENNDVTDQFILGANKALDLCKAHGIKIAILTEGSPSCGSTRINDGQFKKNKVPGMGVTAALLTANNIKVFNQHQLEDALEHFNNTTLTK